MPTLIDGEALLKNSEGNKVPCNVRVTLDNKTYAPNADWSKLDLGNIEVTVVDGLTAATVFTENGGSKPKREIVGRQKMTINGAGGRIIISHQRL